MHENEVELDVGMVRRLVDAQFPEWSDFELRIVEPWGTDNAIWRLGDELVIRMPRLPGDTQVAFEAEWLPRLARHLPVEIPTPVAVGEPGEGYPFRWAVHGWIVGNGADLAPISDRTQFADDLAATVLALWSAPTDGGRPARNRARPVQDYDRGTRRAIESCDGLVDTAAVTEIWERAMAAQPHGPDVVWVHGDLEGNCLTRDGRLCALIDWGIGSLGDPAVDVQVAWTRLFDDDARTRFLDRVGADEHVVARARGAAVNQACAALPYYLTTYPTIVDRSIAKLEALGVDVDHDEIDRRRCT